jgi:hypothetical protein
MGRLEGCNVVRSLWLSRLFSGHRYTLLHSLAQAQTQGCDGGRCGPVGCQGSQEWAERAARKIFNDFTKSEFREGQGGRQDESENALAESSSLVGCEYDRVASMQKIL